MMAYPSVVPPAFTDYQCDHLIARVGIDEPFFFIIKDAQVTELDDLEAVQTLHAACAAFLEAHKALATFDPAVTGS
jgi:hypothetical protein